MNILDAMKTAATPSYLLGIFASGLAGLILVEFSGLAAFLIVSAGTILGLLFLLRDNTRFIIANTAIIILVTLANNMLGSTSDIATILVYALRGIIVLLYPMLLVIMITESVKKLLVHRTTEQ